MHGEGVEQGMRETQISAAGSRLSDATLVRRTVAGELAAFDALVVRHRRAVLLTARALLGDWELAEDATQQTLVEAFRGLPRLLEAVSQGITDSEALAAQLEQSVERTRETLALNIELGLLSMRGGTPALTFPVIGEADDEALYPTVDAVAAQLSTEVLLPCTADTTNRLHALGYGHMEAQFPVWRIWLENFIAGEALRTLVTRDILPAPANPAPANFCMLGWYDTPHPPRLLDWGA